MGDPFDVLATPIKSESDKKEYKVIKLKNELVACIISDSAQESQDNEFSEESEYAKKTKKVIDEKKAAAMLCIGVGSYSDPKEIPGLAHFLEHMVFMGSEKYPSENDFGLFISQRGGTYNAFTSKERTCFYFNCLEKHFREALDKFAQFFIAPLLKKEAMTREREAVDSEFQRILVEDFCRKQQMFLALCDDNSPFNCFPWGNLKTLKEDVKDDKLHEALHQFKQRHYSAHRMTLALLSRLPVDSLQILVLENFLNVPNNSIPKDDFSSYVMNVYNTEKFNRIYYIKPIDETIDLNLTWCLPPLREKYKTKSLNYFTFILGHEGKGSLLSYLKKRVWATNLYVYNHDYSMNTTLTCEIQLTKEGFKQLFVIIEAIFSYINLIKKTGPLERIYEDIKVINNTAFRFASEQSAICMLFGLVKSMHTYPPEHFLTGSKVYYEYDPEEMTMIFDHITPSKVNIFATNKELPGELKFEKCEKWFQIEYTDLPLTDDMKTKWEFVEPYNEFEIPSPNPYLTSDFSLVPEKPNHPDYPQKVIDTDKCELWFRQDQKFKLPIAQYYFNLISPMFIKSAKNSALTLLFKELVIFYLDEEVYSAKIARLTYYIDFWANGIIIHVSGFNEKLPVLIDVIVKYLMNIGDYITEKIFLALKEITLRSEYNTTRSPHSLLHQTHLKLLIKNKWTSLENYNELLTLTYDDMKHFIRDFREELYVKVLVQGNVSSEGACNTVSKFIHSLQFNPLPKDRYPHFIVKQVPFGEKCLYLESLNKNDSNSVILNYYQVGLFSIRKSVILDIIMLILDAHAFDILRTKEQLGYCVYCESSKMEGILGYAVYVMTQVHKFSTEYINARMQAFIEHSKQIIEDTNEKDFQHTKDDYIKTKECVSLQLDQEVGKNWDKIIKDDYIFDRAQQKIEMAKKITLDEVKNWWNKYNNFGEQANYRKISLQVKGHVQKSTSTNEDNLSKKIDKLYGEKMSLIYLGDNQNNKTNDNPDYFITNVDNFRDELGNIPSKFFKKSGFNQNI